MEDLTGKNAEVEMDDKIFQYTPLADPSTEIRLLRFHTEQQCSLETYTWTDAPSYRAISYTWGDPLQLSRININGRAFTVRRNCGFALHQAFRYYRQSCLVWIDAVCINQDDLAEKSAQVAFMGDIFQRAEVVLACVGDQDDSSCFLFQMMRKLLSTEVNHPDNSCPACRSDHADAWPEAWPDGQRPTISFHATHTWINYMGETWFNKFQRDFYDFSCRPFWSRLWIYQEVLLAQRRLVLCGGQNIDLETLQEVYGILRWHNRNCAVQHSPETSLQYQNTGFGMLCRFKEHEKTRLDLDSISLLQCEDPRDRIYGLLRITEWPANIGPPTVDYSKPRLELASDVLYRIAPRFYLPNLYDAVKRIFKVLRIDCESAKVDSIALANKVNVAHFLKPISAQGEDTPCDCHVPPLPRVLFWRASSRYDLVDVEGCLHTANGSLDNDEANFERWTWDISKLSVKSGDILLHLDRSNWFSLWLRPFGDGFYHIVGQIDLGPKTKEIKQSHKHISQDYTLIPGQLDAEFWLCLDPRDIIAFTISVMERKDRQQLNLYDIHRDRELYRFCRAECSSYAVMTSHRNERGLACVWTIDGIPSGDRKHLVCDECGSLFDAAELDEEL